MSSFFFRSCGTVTVTGDWCGIDFFFAEQKRRGHAFKPGKREHDTLFMVVSMSVCCSLIPQGEVFEFAREQAVGRNAVANRRLVRCDNRLPLAHPPPPFAAQPASCPRTASRLSPYCTPEPSLLLVIGAATPPQVRMF